jgi:hypothetical protein
VSVSIASPGGGATFPSGSVWNYQDIYTNNCPGRSVGGGGGSGGGGCGKGGGGRCGSPIVIDTRGTGFRFTNPKKECVQFNLGGVKCLSWPQHGSGVGFLVLDSARPIMSGEQMFGNFSPHSDGGVPSHPDPNGFLSLAWYDRPEQGGNMDGIIDRHDRIWKDLRLWIDEHCYHTPGSCMSRPEELHTLDEFGITSLSLVYSFTEKLDEWGNDFRFGAPLNVTAKERQHSKDARIAYDVFLVAQ